MQAHASAGGCRAIPCFRALGVPKVPERLEPRRLLAEITVNTPDDLNDGDTSNITNLIANPGSTGISLREAILASNNTPGADEINFNIPGAGSHSINPAGYEITDTVTIDGFSQPGSTPNTSPFADNAILNIQIDGPGGTGFTAFRINDGADGTIIQGVCITGWGVLNGAGIGIAVDADDVIIRGNRIGIDALGEEDDCDTGIFVAGSRVLIGGLAAGDQNIISYCGIAGIELRGTANKVIGNLIGTGVDGGTAAGNATGIRERGRFNEIGGPGVGGRNIISGNLGAGVDAQGERVFIGHNFIGLGAQVEPLGNGGDGVRLLSPLFSESIPQLGSEKDWFNAPVIAHNGGHGVNIVQGDAAIENASIHSNVGEGIEAALPNTITLHSAETTTTATTITGTASGLEPGQKYSFLFCGNSASGEFEATIGEAFVFTADANGNVDFIAVLPACGLPNVSATASIVQDFDFVNPLRGKSVPIPNVRPPVIEITNTNSSGAGSASAAFTTANGTPGPEVILFNIPGAGYFDISPASPIVLPNFSIVNVVWDGRGQGLGHVMPRSYINVGTGGVGQFVADGDTTVAGIGFFNVGGGRAWDADGNNNTLIHSTIGTGAAEQALGVPGIVSSVVARIFGGINNRIIQNIIHAGRNQVPVGAFGGTDHLVRDNRIGVTPSGVVLGGTATTNNRVGVSISTATNVDVIGNTIAGMTQEGIVVGEFAQPGGTGHTFSGNRMFQNQGQGIDLGDNGVTPNDGPGDPDAGPNNLQNYPVIDTAEQVPGGTRIVGSFDSGLNMSYSLEASAASSTPAINTNEGARSLGTLTLATDGDGSVTFDLTFPGVASFGERILITATAPDGSTSEYSVSVPLADNVAPTVFDPGIEFELGVAVSWDVSEGGVTGIDPNDVVIESVPPGTTIPVLNATYIDAAGRIVYSLPASTPDGNYRATFQPNAIQDAAGNPGPSSGLRGRGGQNPLVIDFFVLAGDANRDRAVDISDLAILATNWQQTGRTFSQGDFNYDGTVDISDLAILATNWQVSLPAPVGRGPWKFAPATPLSRPVNAVWGDADEDDSILT